MASAGNQKYKATTMITDRPRLISRERIMRRRRATLSTTSAGSYGTASSSIGAHPLMPLLVIPVPRAQFSRAPRGVIAMWIR